MNKTKRILLLMILVPVLFFGARNLGLLNMRGLIESRNCKDERRLKTKFLIGEVVDKYRDRKNHNTKTLVLKMGDGTTMKATFLMLDISGAFDRVQIGDMIKKKEGSLELFVESDSSDYQVQLDYDCNED